MKQIILLIFIIFSYVNAYELKLNKKDISYIKNSPKKSFIINRINKFQTLKKRVVDYELIRKLSHINSFLNKILPAHDISHKSSEDYWATPKEFLLEGHGDCEDYAIAKYFSLRELGVPDNKLRITYVTYRRSNSKYEQAHMVLTYYHKPGATPIVLDNINKKLKLATKRPDLKPVYSFNATGLWQAKNRGSVKVGRNNLRSWKDLMSRF